MTTTDIAKLRELLDNATPGEWEARQVPGTMPAAVCSFGVISHATGKETSRMWTADDARLIAAAHNALPALLDAWEALVEILDIVEQGDTTDVWKLALQNARAALGSQS